LLNELRITALAAIALAASLARPGRAAVDTRRLGARSAAPQLGREGDDEPTIHAKIRQRFFEQYCSDRYDTRFITGSMLKHPGSFLILGLVHPRRATRPKEQSLF
jgi:hypothetical protein